MRHTKSKNTKPERRVFWVLRQLGIEFETHVSDLPGKPDVVIYELKVVIFVNGCFFHYHGCPIGRINRCNEGRGRGYFKKVKKRDRENKMKLKKLGWEVITIWECQTVDMDKLESRLDTKLFG
jgi:DNA mismatch endonuclease (patch repair protein)